ncbi:hypothetical protein [Sulfuriferula multivorans]|uniref:hypothetical protein n=1 Tax=Sulfuriferula multivorans TaxID=1559896 RepID=UPI000F5BBE50|nr:hypothetical protein [Sulfuriferula multivorans]
MKFTSLLLTLCALIASPSFAAPAPATTPATGAVTAVCKDGTNFSGETRKGACKGHKGVQTWGSQAAAPAATAPKTTSKAAPITTPAAGGGAGKVWVNTKSNTYHCMGTKYYGKTKEGAYMTEAEAKAKGAHADHGKACK